MKRCGILEIFCVLLPFLLLGQASGQQKTLPGPPRPRLLVVSPCGGRAGSSLEVTLNGQNLDDPQELLFSHPGIKAEAVPPPASPKKGKPAPKPQARFRVTIGRDVPFGLHDVRVVNRWGISNPRAFVVGDLPEISEKEPNNDVTQAQRVPLNITVNGVISSPTDVDYFVFTGKKGQRVILSCLASSIDSRLRAALELYDSAGHELAANHHYQDLDALLDYTLENDGDFYIRMHGFTYALGGAEEFYRLTISTGPWIDAVYPPMVRAGQRTHLTIFGRNLPGGKRDPSAISDECVLEKIEVDWKPGAGQLAYYGRVAPRMSALDGFEYRLHSAAGTSNPYLLTYAQAPVVLDNEHNSKMETAQEITLPCEIAGHIDRKHDRDWYCFTARKGDAYGIELFADRLGVPADMYLTMVRGQTKQTLRELDDDLDSLSPQQFFTRTLDPPHYHFVAPADDKYDLLVACRDADSQAGPRRVYRLRITPEEPDFRLIVMPPATNSPDACTLLPGGRSYYSVFVWRLDGWNGEITLSAEDLPAGVTAAPQVIGPGQKQGVFVVSAAPDARLWTGSIKVQGTAFIQGRKIVHDARPATITWPVTQQNIPTISRIDHDLVLAVRERAPFSLTVEMTDTVAVQGGQVTIPIKLFRQDPATKMPTTVSIAPAGPVLTPRRNAQPQTVPPGKDTANIVFTVNPSALPGDYTLVVVGQTQVPYVVDPKTKQKTNVFLSQPSNPIRLSVLPKQWATVTLTPASLMLKPGTETKATVKVAAYHDLVKHLHCQFILPPKTVGIHVDEVVFEPGERHAKLVFHTDPGVKPGKISDGILRVGGKVNGKTPIAQDIKFNLTVAK